MDCRKVITIERGGKPCIRGLRITVYDVLEYLASGMSEAEILRDFPDLTRYLIGADGEPDGMMSEATRTIHVRVP